MARLPTRTGAGALLLTLALGCTEPPRATAVRVTSRRQLIGGPRTLGEVGDWRLSNSRVRFIVQSIESQPGVQASRAFGTFGGALIDADLARPEELSDPFVDTHGHDGLGELFPAYFLAGIEPRTIQIVNDGTNGYAAQLRVEGDPAEFLTATRFIDNVVKVTTGLHYVLDYVLEPGDDFLKITASMENVGPTSHDFPVGEFPIPIGFIGLFGEGQPLFLPGEAGYDVRFGLERAYKRKYELPALGGVTSDVVAVDGPGISYGLSYCLECPSPLPNAVPGGSSFVFNHKAQYDKYAPVGPDTMLLPFVSGSLFGLYTAEVPKTLARGAAVSATLRLRVGQPGAAYQLDKLRGDQGAGVGTLAGIVREQTTGLPVPGAKVLVYSGAIQAGVDGRQLATSALADDHGRYTARVPPGDYSLVVRLIGHPNSAAQPVTIRLNELTYVEPRLPRHATLVVEVTDETGRRVPAKVTLDAPYGPQFKDQDPKTFLYDLKLGDPYRPTDLLPDTDDPETRRYIEGTFRTVDGRIEARVRPGSYRLTVSRGPAYSIVQREISLVAGEATTVPAALQRLFPQAGRVAADMHVHTLGSVDSDVTFEDRALSYAAEGIDFLVTTDHNFQVDLRPTIERLKLGDFLQSTTGIELSALEAGHWSGYPLRWEPGTAAHGAMPWFRRPPADLFADLRAHGVYGPDDTVVQVNHPRDSVQGYFTAYGMTGDALTGSPAHDWPGKAGIFAPSGPEFGAGKFSEDFDAIEVFNGKRLDLLRTYRVPSVLPPPPLPKSCNDTPKPKPCLGPVGTVVRDSNDLVAYPGALEDWEHLLDSGRRSTAVGNSDSHALLDGEGGYPRNLIDLGHPVESARQIDDHEVALAIKAGRVVVTNGPDLRLTVLDPDPAHVDQAGNPLEIPIGETVKAPASGKLKVHLVVEAAPWIQLDRGAILVGQGAGCDAVLADDCHQKDGYFDIPHDAASNALLRRYDQVVPVTLPPGKDTWIAAWVSGSKTLWPVVIQFEVPPLLLNDAISALTAAFGMADELGNLHPTQKGLYTPFALTNPVFVDGNGDGKFGLSRLQRGLPARVDAAVRPPLAKGIVARASGDSARLVDLRGVLEAWAGHK